LAFAAVVVLGLAQLTARGQGRAPRAAPDSKPVKETHSGKEAGVVRQVYHVHGPLPRELANALLANFKGDRDFLVFPVAGSRTLLLSGPKAVVQEAMVLLNAMDRPPQVVRIDVLILEQSGKDATPGLERQLTGAVREVLAKVRELEQGGVLTRVRHVQLATLEGETVRTQVGENKPYVTGVAGTAGGGGGFPGGRGGPAAAVSRTMSYRNVGTMVQVVKPEIGPDGRLLLQLQVEDAQMRTAGSGAELATDEKGAAVPATEFVTFNLESRLLLAPGQMRVEESNQVRAKTGQTRKLVLVGASVE
jgi:type II secretory pathway component GspD/PulD (secretin)